jgi:hypothetical protein
MRPPRQAPGSRDGKAVPASCLDLGALRALGVPSTTLAIRSDSSVALAPPAPETTVVPSAKQPSSRDRAGSSSNRERLLLGVDARGLERARRAHDRPRGPPTASQPFVDLDSPLPSGSGFPGRPLPVGFRPTPAVRTRLPATLVAATDHECRGREIAGNLETRRPDEPPGGAAHRHAPGGTVPPMGGDRHRSSSVGDVRAPHALRRRSVWSRSGRRLR